MSPFSENTQTYSLNLASYGIFSPSLTPKKVQQESTLSFSVSFYSTTVTNFRDYLKLIATKLLSIFHEL